MQNKHTARRTLGDYPLSLQSAARALWGDDFWGRHAPIPLKKKTEAAPRGA